ncbi:hypothetical protein D9758_014618 [Tetrapyrgos nigripes]|uniref:WD40 repeat-like protein n=1 Tax=Tetrapyrgos nigripes TaxID=182062 RepID=A0A8H5CXZ4_9AGAR|nr:hypothetical protein D9758_014618 [Tetrapyrgos nigripes]
MLSVILNYLPFWRQQNQYRTLSTLRGNRDAMLSLSFSVDGNFLAVFSTFIDIYLSSIFHAGFHGVSVYDLSSTPVGARVTTPHIAVNPLDPKNLFTASTWLFCENGSRQILLIGTMSRDIHLWEWRSDNQVRQRAIIERDMLTVAQAFETFTKVPAILNGAAPDAEAPDGQVISLDVYERNVADGRHGRMAASFDSRVVTVWSISIASKEVTKVFRVVMEESFLPASIKFLGSLDLVVFKANRGLIRHIDQRTGATKYNKPVEGNFLSSAHVCVDEPQDAFVVWTGKSFDMYRFTDQQHLRAFSIGDRPSHTPKEAKFIEDGKIVIVGSENSNTILYETTSGAQLQTLAYKNERLVQIVVGISTNEHHLVAIAIVFLVVIGFYTLLVLFVADTDVLPVHALYPIDLSFRAASAWHHLDLVSMEGLFQQADADAQDSATANVVIPDAFDGAVREKIAQDSGGLAQADVTLDSSGQEAVIIERSAQDGSVWMGLLTVW